MTFSPKSRHAEVWQKLFVFMSIFTQPEALTTQGVRFARGSTKHSQSCCICCRRRHIFSPLPFASPEASLLHHLPLSLPKGRDAALVWRFRSIRASKIIFDPHDAVEGKIENSNCFLLLRFIVVNSLHSPQEAERESLRAVQEGCSVWTADTQMGPVQLCSFVWCFNLIWLFANTPSLY